MNVLEVTNLVKKYKKATVNAVDDISFKVQNGEFFAFLGPNGAGKTTTISMLTTTLSKTSGKIMVNGIDIDENPAKVRSNIGVIFQNPSLDLNLTAEENIRLHTILYNMYSFRPTFGLMPKEYKDKVIQLSEVLNIKEEIFNPIKTFSGGMKRKLEIIRTLIHQPKVLFLDEPTSGLDPLSRKNLWEYLQDIRKKHNTTIFLTTHYLEEAESADKICVVNNGKIIMLDSLESIKQRLVKNHLYIESANTKALENEIKKSGHSYTISGKGFNIHVPNSKAHQLIKNINTPLSKINILQPTLEDAYLDLIKE